MELSGEARIAADRGTVWGALTDAEVLKASIPGCESLVKEAGDAFQARVVLKIGPIKAAFDGRVTLGEIDPPRGYVITGEGQGGVAGFAKGAARVTLEVAEPGVTVLRYDVKAQVGGKIAQLGARMLESTSRTLAAQFFDTFAQQIPSRAPTLPEPAPPTSTPRPALLRPTPFRLTLFAVLVLVLVGLCLRRR